MKITNVRVFELKGTKRTGLSVFETDHPYFGKTENAYHHQLFTEIETDEGISGIALGGSQNIKQMGRLLIGEDPMRIEYLWERMYTENYVRFQSTQSIAILDLALWDLVGKAKGEPVYRLLGGHFREKIPAYAAMLGFSTEPKNAAESSIEWVEKGFRMLKWYLPYNETQGEEGLKKNVKIIEAVRRAVGNDIGIMIDFGVSGPDRNSLLYMIRLAQRLEEYDIKWLEEPLNYDDIEAYKRLAKATVIPLACGERWYNRWQIKALIESEAISVLQPDPYFAMGITELRKIISFASAYGLPVTPHANESCIYSAQLLFSNPERTCPFGEFGIRLNHIFQYFFTDFYAPVDGDFVLPKGPGFGCEIDWDKVTEKSELVVCNN